MLENEVDVKEVLVVPGVEVEEIDVDRVQVICPALLVELVLDAVLEVVVVPGALLDDDVVPGTGLEVEEKVVDVADELVLLLEPPPMPTPPMESVGASPAQYSLMIRLVTGPPGYVATVVTVV